MNWLISVAPVVLLAGIGPSLHGVFGRPSGTVPGFKYSDAMKRAGLGNLYRSISGFSA